MWVFHCYILTFPKATALTIICYGVTYSYNDNKKMKTLIFYNKFSGYT